MIRTGNKEKPTVVISLGSRLAKVGIAGEDKPIVVPYSFSPVDSMHEDLTYEFSDSHALTTGQKSELKANAKLHEYNGTKMYDIYRNMMSKCLMLQGEIGGINEYRDNALHKLFLDIFLNKLRIDSALYKVLLIDSDLSIVDKYKISKLLLTCFQFQSIRFISEPSMSMIAAGQNHGLVLDFGWDALRIHPMYEMIEVSNNNSLEYYEYSGKNLYLNTAKLLISLKNPKVDELLRNKNEIDFIEKLIVDYFFVRPLEYNVSRDLFEIADRIQVPNSIRYEVVEQLFFHEDILNKIKTSIDKLDIHIRKEVIENLIITGGISNIPGFKLRLLQELKKLFPQYDLTAKTCLDSWTGGSIYSSTKLQDENNVNEITKSHISTLSSSSDIKLSAFPDIINNIYQTKVN
ncbi:uncharacterized protein RJT21DRAFT_115411 [Scheffersomyces amazonensis]|uniref:uncharacterized protein n=1 Tax=Scheffersomyces amazonensis TaxID=1078765 RepID=UPI00315D1837